MTDFALDISIIIPSFNSIKTIKGCLDALMDQSLCPLEIIVVDSSEDETPVYIRQNYPFVHLIHLENQIFPGPARNLGAKIARGSILAFIDADCIPARTWLEQIAHHHSSGILVVGGSIDVGDKSNPISWAGHLMEFREFLPIGPCRFVNHIPSCNISYRKSLFEGSGGFPEAYYPQEDLLLDYLLLLEGVQILFDPSMCIRHFCRDTLHEYLSHQHRIGRVTRCVLKKLYLNGSVIIRNSWLAIIASLAIGVLKFMRTISIFIFRFPRAAISQPTIIFLIFLGAIWWGRGFVASISGGLSGIKGWEDPDEPIFSKIILNKLESEKG